MKKRRYNFKDLTGQQFGYWNVKSYAGYNKWNSTTWNCECKCKTTRIITGYTLTHGKSKSCGCKQKESQTWTAEKQRTSRRKWIAKQPNYRATESRRWRLKNPEKCKLYRRQTNYRIKYGLELEQIEQIFAVQRKLCAICNEPAVLGGKTGAKMDHNHKTGQNRGILCSVCNTSLGGFKDNPEILSNAIKYLAKYSAEGEIGLA